MQQTAFGVVLSIVLVGCGGDTIELGEVEGTVTLDGEPLPQAFVEFTPQGGGRPCVAQTDDNGYYELAYTVDNDGAPPGQYRVSITTWDEGSDDEGNNFIVPEKVPMKYNANTELLKEVKSGSNTIDFELDSEGEIFSYKEDDVDENADE